MRIVRTHDGYPRANIDKRHQIIGGGAGGRTQRWWDEFNTRWRDCQRCPLAHHRNKVVQFRGIIPADILFIGEAPWISEDELGRPFCGPAGRLLDELITEAGIEDGDFCLVNIVACIPRQIGDDGKPFGGPRPPEKDEAKACSPRLSELIEHIAPKLVVRLGNVAGKYVDPFLNGQPVVDLVHPSYILQKKSSIIRKRFVLELHQAVQRLRCSLST